MRQLSASSPVGRASHAGDQRAAHVNIAAFCGDEHVSRDDTLQLHSLSSSNRANSTHRQKSLVVLCRTWPMTVSRYNVRFWRSKHPAVHWLSYSSYIKVGCWRSRRGTAMMRCPIVATYQQTSVHWTDQEIGITNGSPVGKTVRCIGAPAPFVGQCLRHRFHFIHR